jgi:hypothetical protein
MTNSEGSWMVVGNEGPLNWLTAVVTVPDGSHQGEQSLPYPGHDSLRRAPAASRQDELAFPGLVD